MSAERRGKGEKKNFDSRVGVECIVREGVRFVLLEGNTHDPTTGLLSGKNVGHRQRRAAGGGGKYLLYSHSEGDRCLKPLSCSTRLFEAHLYYIVLISYIMHES